MRLNGSKSIASSGSRAWTGWRNIWRNCKARSRSNEYYGQPRIGRYADDRRAAASRVQGLDRPRANRALVGTEGLRYGRLRDGYQARRRVPVPYALGRRYRHAETWDLPRNRRAGAPGVHLRLGRAGRNTRPRIADHRDVRRPGITDQAHAAPDGLRSG